MSAPLRRRECLGCKKRFYSRRPERGACWKCTRALKRGAR